MKPVNVLLVEDNPGDIELAKIAFEDAKMINELRVISDGQQALDFFEANPDWPDIVLLDINLPKVNGIEILKHLRSHEETRALPVCILTSSGSDQDIIASYQHNTNAYIQKPVDFNKFIETIKSFEEFWLSVVKLPPKQR